MADQPRAPVSGTWSRVIGIVGGLGPHAHIRFEQQLLREAESRAPGRISCDQDYPPYLVVSLPGTPDRTEFALGGGPSPLPWLERSLRALRGSRDDDGVHADFAVIACNAAHAVLPELRAKSILPILNIVEEAVTEVQRRGGIQRIGLLATTGTLEAGIYQNTCRARGLEVVSLADLAEGRDLQESLVMATIYGTDSSPGIKAGAHREAETRRRLLRKLERATELLVEAGAEMVLTACTEIPLVLRPGAVAGIEVVDPLEIAARAALAVAAGEREVENGRATSSGSHGARSWDSHGPAASCPTAPETSSSPSRPRTS